MTTIDTAPAPSWAKGFDIAFLKECAALFRSQFKAHTYGAFGIPKERDIADARSTGNLIWSRASDSIASDVRPGDVAAAAIFRQLKVASTHEDFAGRKAQMQPGDLFIKAIAGAGNRMRVLIETLITRSSPACAWLEIHMEDQAARALADELGFEWVMTKIAASSDLKGLFFLAVANDTPYRVSPHRLPDLLEPVDVPGVKVLAWEFISDRERATILDECDRHATYWSQHYSSYNKRHTWTAFSLEGYDRADPSFIIKPSEMSKGWKAENPDRKFAMCGPTVAAARFPSTMAVVNRLPGQRQRVRLMRLSAGGGELTRHSDITDPDAGTEDGQIMRIHVPLITDPRCLFRSWDQMGAEQQLHFPERALCYIDTRKPHAVVNPSGVDRVHLVVDLFATTGMRNLIR